jgi:hypothetical protein
MAGGLAAAVRRLVVLEAGPGGGGHAKPIVAAQTRHATLRALLFAQGERADVPPPSRLPARYGSESPGRSRLQERMCCGKNL